MANARRPLKAARRVPADDFWRCWRTDTLPTASAPSASRRTFFAGPNFAAFYSLSDVRRQTVPDERLLRLRQIPSSAALKQGRAAESATPRLQPSAPKSRVRIEYSFETRTGARCTGTVGKKKPMRGCRKRAAGQSGTKRGWCGPAAYQRQEFISSRLLACDALFFNLGLSSELSCRSIR